MSENVTTVKWWKMTKGSGFGAWGQQVDGEGNTVGTFGTSIPTKDAKEVTEAEFVEILRGEVMADRDRHLVESAQGAAAVIGLNAERQTRIDELVGLGISEETAQAMIPAAPAMPPSLDFQISPEAAGFLRSSYYLSQESIDAVLAPVEEG